MILTIIKALSNIYDEIDNTDLEVGKFYSLNPMRIF